MVHVYEFFSLIFVTAQCEHQIELSMNVKEPLHLSYVGDHEQKITTFQQIIGNSLR